MNEENTNTRNQMMDEIRATSFYLTDLNLYLDINPDDKKALCLANETAKNLRTLTDNYQKIYGPLTIEYPCNSWRWLEDPWPWEKGGSF